jgi:SAM-dependent methyltransferase
MTDSNTAWTSYWQAGHRHSCFSNGAPLPVAAIWESVLSALERSPACILDAACGGGALSAFLVQKYPDATIYAADAATWLPDMPGVEVRPNTPLEHLPFDDQSVDLVVSQFGLEYANPDQAIPEVVRVLASQGVLVALMHHEDSAVVKAVTDERDTVTSLLSEGGLLNVLHHLATAEQRSVPDLPAVEAAAANAFGIETKRLLTPTRRWALSYIAEMMERRPSQPKGYLAANLQRLVLELRHAGDRLHAMGAAVLSERAIDELSVQLRTAGMHNTRVTLCTDDADAIVGWLLVAQHAD